VPVAMREAPNANTEGPPRRDAASPATITTLAGLHPTPTASDHPHQMSGGYAYAPPTVD